MTIKPGTRVHTTQWGGLDGTVTRVDGRTAYVRWDNTAEMKHTISIRSLRPASQDNPTPAPPKATITGTEAAIKFACLIVTLYIVINILTGWGWRP